MKNIKNQDGIITMLVLITVVFLLSFLISSYLLISNKLKNQEDIVAETKRIYEGTSSMEEIYNSYIGEETIPIYNEEQLVRIGSGEIYKVHNKYYEFSKDATYIFMNDTEFNSNEIAYLDGEDWIPIGKTNIKFDGNGKKITVTTTRGDIMEYNKKNEYKYAIPENKYKKVEYIEGTGTQYINTGVDSTSYVGNIYITLDFQLTSYVQNTWICGNKEVQCGCYSGFYSDKGFKYSQTSDYLARTTAFGSGSVSNLNFMLFARDYNKTIAEYRPAKVKIYSATLSIDDEVVRNFIPCYRISDGIGGMYDSLNNVFYTSDGTEEFQIGPEIVE